MAKARLGSRPQRVNGHQLTTHGYDYVRCTDDILATDGCSDCRLSADKCHWVVDMWVGKSTGLTLYRCH